jgi:phosphohistidine phosphatase
MKLYVMRHGPAEDDAASGRDADRALTASGRDRVRHVAKALAEADEVPLAILTSPLVRAVQTAEIVALATPFASRGGQVEVHRELSPGGHAYGLVEARLAAGARRVMVVGHEPDLSGLVAGLVGAPPPLGMQKGMVVGIRLRNDEAPRLRFVLDPKTLQWNGERTRS